MFDYFFALTFNSRCVLKLVFIEAVYKAKYLIRLTFSTIDKRDLFRLNACYNEYPWLTYIKPLGSCAFPNFFTFDINDCWTICNADKNSRIL